MIKKSSSTSNRIDTYWARLREADHLHGKLIGCLCNACQNERGYTASRHTTQPMPPTQEVMPNGLIIKDKPPLPLDLRAIEVLLEQNERWLAQRGQATGMTMRGALEFNDQLVAKVVALLAYVRGTAVNQ